MASTNREKRALEDGENSVSKYIKSGSSESFHGTCYHIKLMMLYIARAYGDEKKFEIACDWKQAGKLDDIVYEYSKVHHGKCITFLQAKHKIKENKINLKNLESEDDFNLMKYFKSYKHIENCSDFKNFEIKELIIATNMKLADNLKGLFEDADDINDLRNGIKFHKFKNIDDHPNNDYLKKIKTMLLEFDELREVAKELATKFKEDKKIAKNNELLHIFHKPLTKNILDISDNIWKFRLEFLTTENEILKRFRDYFKEFATTNDLNTVSFKISNDFGNENCSCSNHQEELPALSTHQSVDTFLKKFRFLETPNEDKFKNVLKNELGKLDIFRDKNVENVYCRFYENISEWFKSVDNEGRAEKKNSKEISEFFETLSVEC